MKNYTESFLVAWDWGVRVLYECMKPNTDPLGADNMLGFMPGLLTDTQVPIALKNMVVTKSPLTNT